MSAVKRRLPYADRWFHDGIAVTRQPAFVEIVEIEMTNARAALEFARAQGLRLSYVHLLVWAASRVLSGDPRLHRLLCGNTVVEPRSCDIAVSVAGDGCLSPVLIVNRADAKSLPEIVAEIQTRVSEVQSGDRDLTAQLNRFGWLLPFGFLRRGLIRCLRRSSSFRRKGGGTFQISVLSQVDMTFTPIFSNTAILTAGSVRDRVVAVNGKPAVRPTMLAACSADHRLVDGKTCQDFLVALRQSLENDLTAEIHSATVTAIPSELR